MSARTIVLRYTGQCAECGTALPPGVQARFYGHGILYGLTCHAQRPTNTGSQRHKPTESRNNMALTGPLPDRAEVETKLRQATIECVRLQAQITVSKGKHGISKLRTALTTVDRERARWQAMLEVHAVTASTLPVMSQLDLLVAEIASMERDQLDLAGLEETTAAAHETWGRRSGALADPSSPEYTNKPRPGAPSASRRREYRERERSNRDRLRETVDFERHEVFSAFVNNAAIVPVTS